MGQVGTSRDIPGCEGTFETWDLVTVLGRTNQDIPGYSEALHYLGQLGKSMAVLDIYTALNCTKADLAITDGQSIFHFLKHSMVHMCFT